MLCHKTYDIKSSNYKEACVETFDEAVSAEKNGADRIELCSRLDLDGLKPDRGLIRKTVERLTIPIKVMIRPKSGNFIYSDDELNAMKDSIKFCKKIKVKGVVFGILDHENHLRINQIKQLAELASPLEVTIHKAIDQTPDLLKAVSELIRIRSITSILTSGGAQTAIEGKDLLRKIIQLSGNSIIIIPAGRITNSNFNQVHELIGANEYHGRNIVGDLTVNQH